MAFAFDASAQRIENFKASYAEGKVLITYDLISSKPADKFKVELYGSHNNYSVPIKLVTGDVGKNIGPGVNKSVEWNAAVELGTFNGDVVFKLKGELLPPPLVITSPTEGSRITRGKTTEIKWTGGAPGNPSVSIDLTQKGAVVKTIVSTTNNNGAYTWSIPADLPKGEYTMKLTNGPETAQRGAIKVKSKLPLWVKLAPIAVVGVVVAILAKGGGGGDEGSANDELPNAPKP